MPQIAPNVWKAGYEYFWFRQYEDGRTEYLFNLETGEENLWGAKTPEGLVKVGWLPMTLDLANKIYAHGEFGYPIQDKPHVIALKPGQEPICYRDNAIITGYKVTCKACSAVFRSMSKPSVCPSCGAGITTLSESRVVNPFILEPAKWDDTAYVLGVKGVFEIRFNSRGLLGHA